MCAQFELMLLFIVHTSVVMWENHEVIEAFHLLPFSFLPSSLLTIIYICRTVKSMGAVFHRQEQRHSENTTILICRTVKSMGTVFHRQKQRHSENTTILKSMSALLTRQERRHSDNAQPFFNQWAHYQLDKNSNAVRAQPLSKNVLIL